MDCQRACVKSSGANEPKGVSRHATWMKPAPTQLSGPAPGMKMLGAVGRKKTQTLVTRETTK